MNNPLISIVICCHNRAHLLPKTMESVFAQVYQPVEIVVVDDGSTDNTPEIMAGYREKVRYYWQENQGVAIARTNACRLTRGEFIAFQDDDDLMPPNRIVQLYEALSLHPSAVLAVGDWAVIDVDGNLTGRRTRFNIQMENEESVLIKDGYRAVLWPEIIPTPHTTLFRRADGERLGWFDARFFHAYEDMDFFARCGQLGAIVYVPKVVSYYRQTQGALCSYKVLLAYSRLLFLIKHFLSMKPLQKELKDCLEVKMFKTLRELAFYQSIGVSLPDTVSRDLLARAVLLLGPKYRLGYVWHTRAKLPIRRILLKSRYLTLLNCVFQWQVFLRRKWRRRPGGGTGF